jgi:hypothetical protein
VTAAGPRLMRGRPSMASSAGATPRLSRTCKSAPRLPRTCK